MAALVYNGSKGKRYTVGREIGRGGEGTVSEVREDAALVIKIYVETLTNDRADKLRLMVTIEHEELQKFAAWPLDIVLNPTGQVCGFVMRKLEGFMPLHSLFSPMDRKKLFPDKGYNFLIHVARNLAVAFHKIHQSGIITGDVNSSNILVNTAGMVALIDCDSIQVNKGSRYYFCEVGVPGYTPPELLERGSFENVIRTENTDAFSLAILIFQLLFLGRHPFTGRNLTNEDFDEEKAIRTGEFAYSLQRNNKKLLPAKNSFDLRNLNDGVIKLFHQAFESRISRPQPGQWVEELSRLGKEMVTCTKSKLHQYPRNMTECPWCLFKEKAGIVYFLDDNYLQALPQMTDIDHFVNGFKLDPIVIKKLSANYTQGNLKAKPIPHQFARLKKINTLVTWSTIGVTIGLCFYNWAFILAGIFFLLLFNFLFPARLQIQRELQIRKNTFSTLKNNFDTLINQHNNPNELVKYNQQADRLTNMIGTFKNLPAEFNSRKKKIEERFYNQAHQTFLAQFSVADYPITSFASGKKTLLQANGITTAADISRLKSLKINGIGPKNIQILQNWQRQMSATFTYVPNTMAINREIGLAGNNITVEKMRLEAEIKEQYKTLNYSRINILTANTALEKQYRDLIINLYQAELDLKAFEILMK